jgi:hypothetical protein
LTEKKSAVTAAAIAKAARTNADVAAANEVRTASVNVNDNVNDNVNQCQSSNNLPFPLPSPLPLPLHLPLPLLSNRNTHSLSSYLTRRRSCQSSLALPEFSAQPALTHLLTHVLLRSL